MIFLTGGTGFIGSFILYNLLQKHAEVKALKRESSSLGNLEFIFKTLSDISPMPDGESWQNALARVKWCDGDILVTEDLRDAIEEGDIVYHAAASVSFNKKHKHLITRTNIDGTTNIVNVCIEKKAAMLAYVSSVAALARKDGEEVNEDTEAEELKFASVYSESKYRAEMEVWRGVAEGLPCVIINPGIVLGWGDFNNGSAEMFRTVYKGLKYYPTGSNAFVDVRDVADILIRLTEKPEAINNRYVVISENLTYKALFDKIASATKCKAPNIQVSAWQTKLVWLLGELKGLLTGSEPFITKDLASTSSKSYSYSNNKIIKVLDYTFISIDESVKDTSLAFRQWLKINADN